MLDLAAIRRRDLSFFPSTTTLPAPDSRTSQPPIDDDDDDDDDGGGHHHQLVALARKHQQAQHAARNDGDPLMSFGSKSFLADKHLRRPDYAPAARSSNRVVRAGCEMSC
ncbi:hypothetical protein PLICRDRAFT_172963 [Plicaturopsis crispa FD-325 SS-3]|nr:hypothetical protein PLICRDRAFT_172963 [Plicaturopsis crispa FD-325 SS-3]